MTGADGGAPPGSAFYHTVELPSGTIIEGEWDLRETIEDYLGHVSLAGRTVLDVGPATGMPALWMESRGATVTCVEPPIERFWDLAPHPTLDAAGEEERLRERIEGVRASFAYLRELHGSRISAVERELASIDGDGERFDIGLLGCVLLHCRSPMTIIEQTARIVDDQLVVTDLLDASMGAEPVIKLVLDPEVDQLSTWWALSPSFVRRALAMVGFGDARTTVHHQHRLCPEASIPMFTVVARRTHPRRP